MTSLAAEISWTEANQACLVTEFTRLKRLLSTGDDEAGAATGVIGCDIEWSSVCR